MAACGSPRSRKVLLALLLAALVVVIVLEIALRLTGSAAPWLPARYVELSEDLPELDELIAEAGWYDGLLAQSFNRTPAHGGRAGEYDGSRVGLAQQRRQGTVANSTLG